MNDGEMQSFPLTLDRFLDHAAKWHPGVEVITARGDGSNERIGYAAMAARSRRISSVFTRMGVKTGERVATLAWNTQAHVEVWYAVMGMGAVCHTLNPRLTEAQLADMATQSQARKHAGDRAAAPRQGRIADTLVFTVATRRDHLDSRMPFGGMIQEAVEGQREGLHLPVDHRHSAAGGSGGDTTPTFQCHGRFPCARRRQTTSSTSSNMPGIRCAPATGVWSKAI